MQRVEGRLVARYIFEHAKAVELGLQSEITPIPYVENGNVMTSV